MTLIEGCENRKQAIVDFFENHIDELEGNMSAGSKLLVPRPELTPRDFLDFASQDLEHKDSIRHLVSATSNLKRAVDCQLDIFFALLNLEEFKKKLGIDRKLAFLKRSGLFSPKSLSRLNQCRNNLEHEYRIPKINEIEIYYDVVLAFVSIIESAMSLVSHSAERSMSLVSGGNMATSYRVKDPSIEITLDSKSSGYYRAFLCRLHKPQAKGGTFNRESLEEFSFFFRVHHLLKLFDEGVASRKYILSTLKKTD